MHFCYETSKKHNDSWTKSAQIAWKRLKTPINGLLPIWQEENIRVKFRYNWILFPEVILFSPASYLFERNWSLILFVSLSRYHTYYLTGLVLIYNQLGLTCYTYVRYRLFCFAFVTSNEVQNILVLYLWRRNSNEELWNQEMQRIIKD